jgi:hypothetical protein
MATWQYDPARRQYQRLDTGEWLTAADLLSLKSRFLDHMESEARRTSARLVDGSLTAAGWEVEMQSSVVTGYTAMALLGRGGREAMQPPDLAPVGAAIGQQFDYLKRFREEVAGGAVSEAALLSRAALYPASAGSAFERGRAQAFGISDLPAYPGDGSTSCLGNCRCSWDLQETDEGIEATWQIESGDSCDDCLENAQNWAPLLLEREEIA